MGRRIGDVSSVENIEAAVAEALEWTAERGRVVAKCDRIRVNKEDVQAAYMMNVVGMTTKNGHDIQYDLRIGMNGPERTQEAAIVKKLAVDVPTGGEIDFKPYDFLEIPPQYDPFNDASHGFDWKQVMQSVTSSKSPILDLRTHPDYRGFWRNVTFRETVDIGELHPSYPEAPLPVTYPDEESWTPTEDGEGDWLDRR